MRTCFTHLAPDPTCADCVAMTNSLSTRLLVKLRAGCPTPDEQGKLDALKERFSGPEGVIRAGGWAVKGSVE